MQATYDKKAGTLTITVPVVAPRPSSTGKTLLIASEASSYGVCEVAGKAVRIAVNAYIKPEKE